MTATIGYDTETPLNQVPAAEFNTDGIAVLTLVGCRYGGEWNVNLLGGPDPENPDIYGSVWTDATADPEVATNTALAWLRESAHQIDLKIAQVVNHNSKYSAGERPFFLLAQVLLVGKDWT